MISLNKFFPFTVLLIHGAVSLRLNINQDQKVVIDLQPEKARLDLSLQHENGWRNRIMLVAINQMTICSGGNYGRTSWWFR
ncbi:hypothetical protein PANT111_250006 [Pantoea brenneri]|uniref:Uncharacterized protein n=1 Tax=Pantoea brenneri TaxID=472694 RepID=A0AAX3J8W7_9GAMM|nr:hypothetical protein PANT111_250006 [Pantoea brenneri]